MRSVYKIVMGLMLFNAFLTFYSPFFGTALGDNAVDYTSEENTNISRFQPTSVGDILLAAFGFGNIDAWGSILGPATAAIILVGGIAMALITKNYVYIGVALFVSIVMGLYVSTSAVISTIGASTSNVYVTGIIAIVGLAIGLLLVLNIVDMFAPSPTR